jgi:hypothetical protein
MIEVVLHSEAKVHITFQALDSGVKRHIRIG